jgi:hypothetical protein
LLFFEDLILKAFRGTTEQLATSTHDIFREDQDDESGRTFLHKSQKTLGLSFS